MDDKGLLKIAKALRSQQEKILELQAAIQALQEFVALATKSDKADMLVALAEAEHKFLEQEPGREERE